MQTRVSVPQAVVLCTTGAKLVSYSADTGDWVFDTPHWSRFAMDDSDDEEKAPRTTDADARRLMPPPAPPGRGRKDPVAGGRVSSSSAQGTVLA